MIPASWLYRILAGAIAVAAILWLVESRDHWRDQATANAARYRQEQAAHTATVANYRAAVEQARAEDAANLARVEAAQSQINERTADDFQSRIAYARADADRLRRKAASAEAHPRDGRAAPVPGLSAAPEGASEAATEDGFSESDRLLATEQAIQLDELINWVRAQAEVRTGGE